MVRGGFTGVFHSSCLCSVPTPTPARWAGDPPGTVRQEGGLLSCPGGGWRRSWWGVECGRRQVRTGPSEGGPGQLILAHTIMPLMVQVITEKRDVSMLLLAECASLCQTDYRTGPGSQMPASPRPDRSGWQGAPCCLCTPTGPARGQGRVDGGLRSPASGVSLPSKQALVRGSS